jgi:hypothetical protein
MDAKLKTDTLVALRSGKFRQAQGRLKDDGGYCCIGVICVVAGYHIDEDLDRIERPDGTRGPDTPYSALDDFQLDGPARGELVRMNDGGKSFAEIADYIEASL